MLRYLKRLILDFLKFFGIGFAAQIIFLVIFVAVMIGFDIRNPGPISGAILEAYLWPLSVWPSTGHSSNGGELFFMPFTAVIHSLVFAVLMVFFKRIGSPDE